MRPKSIESWLKCFSVFQVCCLMSHHISEKCIFFMTRVWVTWLEFLSLRLIFKGISLYWYMLLLNSVTNLNFFLLWNVVQGGRWDVLKWEVYEAILNPSTRSPGCNKMGWKGSWLQKTGFDCLPWLLLLLISQRSLQIMPGEKHWRTTQKTLGYSNPTSTSSGFSVKSKWRKYVSSREKP